MADNRKKYRHSSHFYRRREKLLKKDIEKVTVEKDKCSKNIDFEKCIKDNLVSCSSENFKQFEDSAVGVLNLNSISEQSVLSTDNEDLMIKNEIISLTEQLRVWATSHNQTHRSINHLLKILRENGRDELPRDARTLLHTPKQISLLVMGNGEFWYHGVEENLKIVLHNVHEAVTVYIKVNVDGMSPFKSSGKELWPILFSIDKKFCELPMTAALYFGNGKPPIKEFLTPFVDELNSLMCNGMVINGHKIQLCIECWICDTPARSYIKGTPNFNSEYGACIKCTVVGEFDKRGRHMSYPNLNSPLRTDESFRNKTEKKHHKEDTPLLKLPMDMVEDVIVADSLHLFHLGIMRKLLYGWCYGSYNYRVKLSSSQIQTLSLLLENCNNTKPREIHRAIRGIKQLRYWKGSEYRTLLLYVGIIVLKDILPINVYEHFLYLFCAAYILSSDHFSKYFTIANEMLRDFICEYKNIYGRDSISSNVHNLCHVVGDVMKFGSLPNISSYQFENYLGILKSYLRHGNKPLSQICNRIVEMTTVKEKMTQKIYPFLENEIFDSMFKAIYLAQDFVLKGDNKINWFLTFDFEIVSMISAKISETGKHTILGEQIKKKSDVFSSPIPSSTLYVYKATLDLHSAAYFDLSRVKCKLFSTKIKNDMVFVPILHTIRK